MRIAVFGDIHGNIYALHAVLADLRLQRPDALVVSGDLVYKFPWGREVVDLLRSFPCECILGNAELYLALRGTALWPSHWLEPVMTATVDWERERLGPERLSWLAQLSEHISFSAGRLDDLLIVHGAPGNPFLTLLARPREDRSPWVQTDQRVRQLLAGSDADMIVAGHSHAVLERVITRADGGRTTIVTPGSLSYNRGHEKGSGRADYALLDWAAATGWRSTLRTVTYDPAPLHAALLAHRGNYPLAAFVANRVRSPGVDAVPEECRPDFTAYPWGNGPDWWNERDRLPAWRALRGEEDV